MESCRVFTYSPNNRYAKDYYNACKNFDNIRNKIIDYEHSTSDRESIKYEKRIEEFRYWDAKVPERSNIAGQEEWRLKAEQENNKDKNNSLENHKLDFYA